MKRLLLPLLLLLLSLFTALGALGQTVMVTEDFSTDGDNGVRYSSNAAAINAQLPFNQLHYFKRATENPVRDATGATANAITFGIAAAPGNIYSAGTTLAAPGFWANEGVQNQQPSTAGPNYPSTEPGVVELNPIIVTGYTGLQVSVKFADARGPGYLNTSGNPSPQVRNDQYLRVQYLMDGGAWTTVGVFRGNSPTADVAAYWQQADPASEAIIPSGAILTPRLTNFTYNIPGTGTTLKVRVQVVQRGSTGESAFDDISVSGTVSTVPAPVLANIENTNVAYTEGGAPVTVTGALTASGTITSAAVSISGGFVSTEDLLNYSTTSGIAGSYNAGSGVLTLTGAGTAAQYQTAFRAVTYSNSNITTATGGLRTIRFVANNGSTPSGLQTRGVLVTAVLSGPVSIPYTEDLTTDGEGTRYNSTSFTNANGAAFFRTTILSNPNGQWNSNGVTPTTYSGVSNSYYWYGGGTSNAGNPYTTDLGYFTTQQVNGAGYKDLHFKIKLGASSNAWESSDYTKIYYRINGGAQIPLASFRSSDQSTNNISTTGNLRQDADPANPTGTPTGIQLTPALAQFDFLLPAAANGQLVDFIIEESNNSADGAGESFAFDLIQVTGTVAAPPTVTTSAANNITTTSAVLGGNVTADGGAIVTDRGVVYSSSNQTPITGGTGVTQNANNSGTGSFSEPITGLSPATTYYARAYAANVVGTSYGAVISFTTPGPVGGMTVVTNVACNGGSNGTINLTPSGGTGPYTFAWNTGATTEDRTGLTAGTYSVIITDAAGATGTVSNITVTQPPVLNGTTVVTNVACNGGSNGAINLTPSGGTGPYTFNWVDGRTTEDRTGLSAGTYTVTITDVNGCTGTFNATVTQPASAVGGTTVVTNVACNGGSNGAINLTPSGGTGPYTFNWVDGRTTEDRTGLAAGTYTVTITDVNGCTRSVNATVTQPASAVGGTTVVTNVACNGGSNGAINLTPSGGTGPYTFNWVDGRTTEDRTGLSAGTYTVTITDANGCTGTFNATVTQPASAVGGTTVVTNVACNGGSNGAINLTPSGGTGPYTFNWVDGRTTEDRTGLSAGTYTVTITDVNGCTGTFNATVTQPASAVGGTTVVTNVACNGGSNGAINLTPSGGTGPYTFNWVDGRTTEDRTGLAAGTYTVTITDVNGCTRSVNATVTQPASAVGGTTVVTNVACNGGSNGAINLTPSGGTGPYTFNWVDGRTTEDRTGLAAGTYTVTITDVNGCTRSVNATVTQPASAVGGTTVVTNVACNGGSNGAINLTPSGGTGPYTFNWVDGRTTEDRTGLAAGTYTVTITDVNGCTRSVNATVTQPASAVGGTTVVTNVACNGGSNGAINLTPSGGTGPYTFNWVDGRTTEDRTGLAAGTYTVTITDVNGCTGTFNATVTQPASAVGGTTVVTNVACNGGSNGAINLTPSGGTGPYTFNWVDGRTTEDRTGLAAGTYTVTITDVNGCTGTFNATVTQPASAVGGTTVVTNVACNGGSNGAINLTPSGGTGPYTFNWVDGRTTEDRTGLSAGTYTVTITDANGCTGTFNATVTQPASAVGGTTVVTNVACNGGSNGAINLTPSGGTGPYTFNWVDGRTTEDRTGLAAGTYTVVITDVNGCTRSVNATVTQPAAIVASTRQTDVTTNGGNDGSATITVSGGTPSYTYSWSPNVSTTATATNLSAGSYTVTATDANGCTIARTLTIAQPAAPLTATVSTPSASPTSTAPIPFLVAFSQSVGTTFTASDVTVAGGSLTSSSFSGSGAGPYTFTVTPIGTGPVTVSLAANVATDANNTGNSASNAVSVQFQAPTITVTPASLPDGTQGSAYSQTFTATGGSGSYTYALSGSVPSGLSLSGNTLSGTPTATGPFTFRITATDGSAAPGPYSGFRNYTLTINPQPVTAAPIVTAPANGALINTATPIYTGTAPVGSLVSVYVDDTPIGTTTAGTGIWSLAQPTALTQGSHQVRATAQLSGLAVSGNSNQLSFTVDTLAPTVVVASSTGASGSTTGTTPIPLTVTFSEPVTGFVAADLSVSGGTVTDFAGSGTSYTVTVTPAADGLITVNVPANVAQDGANNGNTASSVFSITYSRPVTATPVVVTPANGTIVISTKPTYTGTATALASLTLVVDENTATSQTTTVEASGNWTLTPLSDLAPGAHTVQARAQLAGQTASAYSAVNSFTVVGLPSVVTATPTGVSSSSATLGGEVTNAGAGTVSERGVVYLAGSGTPTTSDTKVIIGAGTGSFAQAVTNLTSSTTYAVRAYAINQAGTSYGATQVVSTGNALAINSVTPSAVCAGATISVAYTNSSPGTPLMVYLNGPSTSNLLLTTLNASQASGTITATIPADRAAGPYSVYLSGAGASSGSVNVTVNAIPSAPTTSPVTVCQNTTPVSLATDATAADGGSLRWYAAATGGTGSATAPVPPTSTVGQTTYYVSQVSSAGCESGRAALTYTVNALPMATLTNDGPLSCTRPAVTLTAGGATGVPGSTYRFSAGATQAGTPNLATVSLSGVYSVTVTDGNGCSATNQTTVTSDQSNPQAGLTNDGPLTCAKPTVTLTAAGNGSYRFSAGATPIGTGNQATVTTGGVYSVTVTAPNGCSATAQTTVDVNTSVAAPTLTASALSTENTPIIVTASGCSGGTVNWTATGGSGTASGSVYTVTQPGNYTLTATCTVGNCTSPAAPALSLQIRPGGFAIRGVELVQCQLLDAGRGQYEIRFTPQYSGLSGSPVNFSVTNELAATTAPGPYTLRLYTDNATLSLVASQNGTQASFRYNWLAACSGSQPAPNRPPVAQPIPDQVLVVGQNYQLELSRYFTDPEGQSLSFTATGLPAGLSLSGSRISGSPTQAGTATVQLTALDPGGLSAGGSVLLRVDPAPVTPTPGVFSIAGVTGVRCETLSAGERQLSFSPVYTGLTGAPVSFGIPNELGTTTAPGPYSLKLYTDNPAITLTATQDGTQANYRFSWLAACPTGSTTLPVGNRPPAVGTGLGNQTAPVGQGYTLFIPAGTFTDPDNDPLRLSVSGLPAGLSFSAAQNAITGTPAQAGSSTIQVTATDPGGLSVSLSFVLTVQPATTPTPTPGAFSIAGVTGVRCETLSAGERQLSFSPVYTGLTGEPIRFGVVNELATTTAPGPYTLRLYTDNAAVTLTATQGSTQASYRYNWLAACPTNPNGRQAVAEAGSQLSVTVLGNPVVGESVEVLIGGVEGQAVELSLSDLAGNRLHQQQIRPASGSERVVVPISAGQAITILKVSTARQYQTVKLIRP